MVLTVESKVNIDDVPLDIKMCEVIVTTSCAQDLTIPTTSIKHRWIDRCT